MRAVVIALFAAIICPAFGQIRIDEQNIQYAFAQSRLQPEAMLELNGTDKYGPRTNVLYGNAFFKWDPLNVNAYAKAEINDYVNGAHSHRIVADGTTLWSYNFPQNTYSSFKYGSYSGAQPAGFRNNLFQELNSSSQASSTFLARTLREIFAGDVSMYTGWFPGSIITVVCKPGTVTVGPMTPTTDNMVDPIDSTRSYVGDDLNYYVVYTFANRLQRSGAFHLSRVDLSHPWMVSDIHYIDVQYINPSTPRIVDWTITFNTAPFPVMTNYAFVPPANARSIANVKGQGGG